MPRLPELAAVSVVAREPNLPRDLDLMDNTCAVEATELVFHNPQLSEDHRLWLFAAHGPWQPKSAMVKHKKLWTRFIRKWDLSQFHLRDEILLESEEGIRFASVAEVTEVGFPTTAKILREESSCTLILSKRRDVDSQDGVRQIFEAAFCPIDQPVQSSVDWLNLALHSALLKDVVIRLTGSWDEQESALNLIMRREELAFFT